MEPAAFHKPYRRHRLFCSTDGSNWRNDEGAACTDVAFVPAGAAYDGDRPNDPVWVKFDNLLLADGIAITTRRYFAVGADDWMHELALKARPKAGSLVKSLRIAPAEDSDRTAWFAAILEVPTLRRWMIGALRSHCDYLMVRGPDGCVIYDGRIRGYEDVLVPIAFRLGAEIVRVEHSKMPLW